MINLIKNLGPVMLKQEEEMMLALCITGFCFAEAGKNSHFDRTPQYPVFSLSIVSGTSCRLNPLMTLIIGSLKPGNDTKDEVTSLRSLGTNIGSNGRLNH